jgi:hypothetical protein
MRSLNLNVLAETYFLSLARMFHKDSAARRDKPVSTSLRSPTVLTVLSKYASAR